jgi:mRNA interferase RelE/StbE
MKYEVVVAKDAQEQFEKLDGRWHTRLKREMRKHLEHQPKRESKSRIKRLRGLRQPQYRMRVDDMRVFYDVNDEMNRVEVLGFLDKSDTPEWLHLHGVPE